MAESDIEVSDDLQVYILNNDKINEQINEIMHLDNSLQTLDISLSAIFQGFGNYDKITSSVLNPQYLARNNATEIQGKLFINDLEIPANCPFNYKHTIKAGTLIDGLNLETKTKTNIISENQSVLLRVKSWFSDKIYCTGNIKLQIIQESFNKNANIQNMLKTVAKFDFIQRNKGFFKYQQENLHKSNIYSIKLVNTHLNPENDRKLKYFYSENDLINTILNEKPQFNFNNLTYTVNSYSREHFICKNVENNLIQKQFSKTEIFKLLNYNIVKSDIDEIIEIYNISEKEEIDRENQVKESLRNILETAIRKSVSEYMPADTTLWKIIYTGV